MSNTTTKDVKVKKKRLLKSRGVVGIVFRPLKPVWRVLRWVLRHIVPRYFVNSWRELRQVTWLKRKQSRQLTTTVILFAIVLGITVTLVDYGLDKVFKKVILKQ